MLERQRAYFSSDACLRDRAELWRDASPQECWTAMKDLCTFADHCLDQLDTATRERALLPEPLPADTLRLLERLQQQSR